MFRGVRFFPGSTVVTWNLADDRFSGCRTDEVTDYFDYLRGDEFARAMRGVLISVGYVENDSCVPPTTTAAPTTTTTTTLPPTTTTTPLVTTTPPTTVPTTLPPTTIATTTA